MNEKPVVKNVIARCGCDRILPCVVVYILYIILHGHLSPGGGFQGGVLMVALVALVYMGHGYERTVETFSYHLLHTVEGCASIFYVALGLLGVALGAHFAENVLYTHGAKRDRRRQGHHRRRLHRPSHARRAEGRGRRERGEVT